MRDKLFILSENDDGSWAIIDIENGSVFLHSNTQEFSPLWEGPTMDADEARRFVDVLNGFWCP
ncbi:hypothetical protein HGP14_01235 [Rhizobium sp. P32RR-XVIII]|uniref:hypothetical protein n=1 Tax=Rhizobium sp. P32RR-XVIII TaxID=2726738 RepID=UPI0014565028|nr:hypothetical protein [Rhizobium sp. P32RR-XVIII]NLS01993.1 hypothetical protein [Rhizobium sp. P32RR-XVIII]